MSSYSRPEHMTTQKLKLSLVPNVLILSVFALTFSPNLLNISSQKRNRFCVYRVEKLLMGFDL